MFHYHFTPRFYLGITLIVLSFISGSVAKVFLIIQFSHPALRWTWLMVYLVSWLILFMGIWWAGREAYEEIHRYFSYRYYHEKVKHHTQQAWEKTKVAREKVRKKLQRKKTEELLPQS